MPRVARVGGDRRTEAKWRKDNCFCCQLVACWVGSPPAVVMVGWPSPIVYGSRPGGSVVGHDPNKNIKKRKLVKSNQKKQ